MADTDFTLEEDMQKQIEEIGEWLLTPHPGESEFKVDHYNSGDVAIYGVWNLNKDERYALMPGDRVRILITPYDRSTLEISRIPDTWPISVESASQEQWNEITKGINYEETDEVLYDLAPVSMKIDIGDLDLDVDYRRRGRRGQWNRRYRPGYPVRPYPVRPYRPYPAYGYQPYGYYPPTVVQSPLGAAIQSLLAPRAYYY